jgi:dUTP pyrophosphatase
MKPTLKLNILRGDKISSAPSISMGTVGSACWDIHADLKEGTKVTSYSNMNVNSHEVVVSDAGLELLHLSRYLIPTGLSMEIPQGYCVKIYPRSGLSIKKGINLVNGVAVIDSDYRGEVMVLMINLGARTRIMNGDRIAQMELAKVEDFYLDYTHELSSTARGSGGMGSTGQ